MLTRIAARTCAAALVLLPLTAANAAPPPITAAGEPGRAIREPVRLTVGASSELMGMLSADESTLYFTSDANGTSDVMRQAPVQSAPNAISSGLGDAIDPQISPNGKHIAYISFANDATGDACVRAIDGRELGPERCAAQPATAELQVLWWSDASLGVVSRRGLHGDYVLRRVPLEDDARLSLKAASDVIARNMVGLAISPDRRWLAYIPIERAQAEVGVTFSQRPGAGVVLERLDAPGAESPLVYQPRLPGVTSAVAFSERGGFLVFVQFLNDTNRDGTIDGNDNAVIFRVPFRAAVETPIAAGAEPEQLTSARWDCHYPAPAKTQLIASCSHEGSLDVYSLPLDGSVPRDWDDARLVDEIASARDPWTRLLLAARRLAIAKRLEDKESIVLDMMGWHLALGEYESTIYDAGERLTTPDAKAFGGLLGELAQHRRADLALIHGETSEEYVQTERARAARLRAQETGSAPRLDQLRRLVVSEIEDDIGDKAASLVTFRAVDPSRLADPRLAPLVARRAERLYRLRGERSALLEVYRKLSELEALSLAQRLEYAQRFVNELVRGSPRSERAAAFAQQRARVPDGSELALLLDVESALVPLDDRTQEEVRKSLFKLYTANKDPDRRRALVLATLRAAAKAGNEYLQYQFVTSWTSSLPRARAERKYAEQLYNGIVLDRAYGEGRQGKLGESRGYFYASTVATDALEAHIGFIEARLAEGGPDANRAIDEVYTKRFGDKPDHPVYLFVQAYRLARELPSETDEERFDAAVSRCVDWLARVAAALPRQPAVHQLWGFVLHQRARRLGDRQAAVAANRQYLLALDLARDDERLSARLLHRLGILQASLGNYGLALRYLKERDRYPHVRAQEELSLRVTMAQCAWHAGEPDLARAQLRAAEQLTAASPELARYRPLVTDRLALALLSTHEPDAAREEYRELTAERAPSPLTALKAQVGLAASALQSGQPQVALTALERADRTLDEHTELEPEPDVVWQRSLISDYRYTPLQYRALIMGLRTSAQRGLGNDAAALEAMRRRTELLEERLSESEADEDRLEVAQAYLNLAKLHYDRKDLKAASAALERGLTMSDAYNESTGSEVNDVQLSLVQAYAELRLLGGAPAAMLERDPYAELRRAYAFLCEYRNPRFSKQRFLFESYLTRLMLESGRKADQTARSRP